MIWKNRTWQLREYKNLVNLKTPYQYNFENCTCNNELILKTKPKIFDKFELVLHSNEEVICIDKLHFGHYKFKVILPSEKFVSPAIYMCSENDIKIDIMRGYTNKNGKYFNIDINKFNNFFESFIRPFNIKSTYYNKNKLKKSNRIRLGYNYDFKNPITFEMFWSPENIYMYSNNKCYSTLNEKEMQHFQKPMNLILSNNLQKSTKSTSEFKMLNFIYTPDIFNQW